MRAVHCDEGCQPRGCPHVRQRADVSKSRDAPSSPAALKTDTTDSGKHLLTRTQTISRAGAKRTATAGQHRRIQRGVGVSDTQHGLTLSRLVVEVIHLSPLCLLSCKSQVLFVWPGVMRKLRPPALSDGIKLNLR